MIGTPGIKTFLIIRRGSLVTGCGEATAAQTPEGLFHIGIVYGYKKAGSDTNRESADRLISISEYCR